MAIEGESWRFGKGGTERGYGYRWQKARAAYLSEHPLCAMCRAEGRVTAATVVDHITPHKGDKDIFWDEANWQPLCKTHHDTDKAEQEGRHKAKAKFGTDSRVIW